MRNWLGIDKNEWNLMSALGQTFKNAVIHYSRVILADRQPPLSVAAINFQSSRKSRENNAVKLKRMLTFSFSDRHFTSFEQ